MTLKSRQIPLKFRRVASSRESKSGFTRPWAAFFALIIILGGVAVSLGFGVRLRAALERNAQSRMATSSQAVQTAVTTELGRYADAVRLSAAALSAQQAPTATAFDKIAAAVGEQKLTAVRAMTFIAPGEDGMTARWRSRGATGFKPETASGLHDHMYTVFTHALDGKAAPAIGVDQGAAQAVLDATRLATSGAGVAISDAYVALADARIPKAQQQLSFDVIVPVQGFGFMSLSVAATDFVTTSLSRAAGTLLDAQLLTRAGTGTLTEVATVARGNGIGFRRTENFTAGERQWVLRTSAPYQALLPNTGRTDMVVVIAGATLAVMFGTLLYLQMSATARAEREIAAEVAEQLEQAGPGRLRQALAAQETLLSNLLSAPGTPHDEVDLQAIVAQAAARTHPAEITIGPLPPVRANVALLTHLIDTMLADALSRPPEPSDPSDPTESGAPTPAGTRKSSVPSYPAGTGPSHPVTIRAEQATAGTIRLVLETAEMTISCLIPANAPTARPAPA
ncbi:hypothetical protein, partial [Actinoplanes sp. TFC3]|uniref:hypothetical protein n=1 Tax=Actinoplanes sp. TFC3 TaxID=1710355 RepID=UPI00137B203C